MKLREMAMVACRLAASILPEPLSACAVLATGALLRGDNEALKTSLLPSVCAGDLMPTAAWQERAGDLDHDRVATEATETPGGFAISGTKRFVPYGDAAVAHFESGATSELHGAMASRAKARCSHTALEVARESIQLHGAIGWTDECDVGLYVKRALVLSAWLGNAAANRRRYARLNPVATAGN